MTLQEKMSSDLVSDLVKASTSRGRIEAVRDIIQKEFTTKANEDPLVVMLANASLTALNKQLEDYQTEITELVSEISVRFQGE